MYTHVKLWVQILLLTIFYHCIWTCTVCVCPVYPQLPDTLSLIYSYLYILVYVHVHCSFYTPLVYVVHVVLCGLK